MTYFYLANECRNVPVVYFPIGLLSSILCLMNLFGFENEL